MIPPDGIRVQGIADPHWQAWITGTGQVITQTHPPSACRGEGCVVHHPSDHHMRDFPTHWRSDRGITERICPHGVGHPDPDEINPDTTHGCDGCCAKPDEAEL